MASVEELEIDVPSRRSCGRQILVPEVLRGVAAQDDRF
jgi:hypothetical protein